MSDLQVHLYLNMSNSWIIWRLLWNCSCSPSSHFEQGLLGQNLGLQLNYYASIPEETLNQSNPSWYLIYEVEMNHLLKMRDIAIFSNIFIEWHFRNMVSFVFLPCFKLIQIFLTWWLHSWLNNMNSIYTLVGALISMRTCKQLNTIIRTWIILSFFFILESI